ncbi:hypothetical protein COCOR_01558 [Corallococcus coralloides DSM 2259]|uniref:DUF4340 domain-containing protein n=1 Tax=Corallococcus coralloides (strain ATCC 25202 / DSM 2259 / NBRC 100086 / M2) TaxID=1144275 RepID=H8MWY1_CORCM|nr:hypothetical protein [Corallococcus coralloides]AFE04145.1 hypothetical protein COCOR_01558 [Corallococcus coralloides DSM 2259]
MKARDVAVQGVLAGVALVAAFVVWQREPSRAPGEVTVEDAQASALDRIRYDEETRFVELFRDPQDRDTIWVRLGNKPARPEAGAPASDAGSAALDAGALARASEAGALAGAGDAGRAAHAGGALARATSDAGSPANAGVNTGLLPAVSDGGTQTGALASASADGGTPVPPPRELRGNDVALKLFSRFAPLRAQRDLGVLDDKKLDEIGLAKTERGLTLTLDGTPRTFRLATPASGWGAPYLQRASDGHVFLLGPGLLPDLEAASSRLVDRRLHTFDVDGFDHIVISTGTTSRIFAASGKPPGAVQLSPVDAPGTPDDFARNWHDRLWRLTPVELLGRGEALPGPAPTPAFRVEYQRGGKAVGELTMAKTPDGSWYARTEFTPGWVRMGGGLELLAEDAAKLTAPR